MGFWVPKMEKPMKDIMAVLSSSSVVLVVVVVVGSLGEIGGSEGFVGGGGGGGWEYIVLRSYSYGEYLGVNRKGMLWRVNLGGW